MLAESLCIGTTMYIDGHNKSIYGCRYRNFNFIQLNLLLQNFNVQRAFWTRSSQEGRVLCNQLCQAAKPDFQKNIRAQNWTKIVKIGCQTRFLAIFLRLRH